MVDTTTDKSNSEIVSIVCRYIVEGTKEGDIEVVEHVVHMEESADRSAKALCDLVTRSLKNLEISLDRLVSQCYDGASVMPGEHGGLQAFCKRFIVYIHCFCHKLHLAVVAILENIDEVSQNFSTVSALYNFFKKVSIRDLYDGNQLQRLLPTRWSGHREATFRLKDNYGNILQCLLLAASTTSNTKPKIESTDVALATGLTTMISENVSVFLTFMIEIVDIGNKTLQSRGKQNLASAVAVIKSVKSNVKALKTDYPDESSVIDAVNKSMDVKLQSERVGEKRLSSVPSKLIEDFDVTERLPSASSNKRRPREFKPLLVEMVDLLWSELNERFDDKNTSLWESMASSKTFLNPVSLEKLFEYALTVPVIARSRENRSIPCAQNVKPSTLRGS